MLPRTPQRRLPGPRRVIGSIGGIQVVEAAKNGTKGMCCGAGGARMWMEESIGKKVNDERSQEAVGHRRHRIATACPFCYIMIDDGVKAQGVEETDVKVADIAMHLLDAIEEGARRPRANPGSRPRLPNPGASPNAPRTTPTQLVGRPRLPWPIFGLATRAFTLDLSAR